MFKENFLIKKSKLYTVLLCLIFLGLESCTKNNNEKVFNTIQYVNPNIGTAHSRWFFYTPASLPFGMAKLAPTTDGHYGNVHGFEAVGYDERHTSIEGFANLHEFQIGGIKLMPTTGKLITIPGKLEEVEKGYRSNFDRADEVAKPGYYKVKLKDYNVTAELTATKRVGFHRYIFPKSSQSNILFDIGNELGESGNIKDAFVEFDGAQYVKGYVITTPKYVNKYQNGAEVPLYFIAQINKKPETFGVFNGDKIQNNKSKTTGLGAGVYLTFHTEQNEAIDVKVGLSYTSIENAKLNLEAEAKDLEFEDALASAETIWNNELSKIKVEGDNETDKIKFYTALYHVLLGRGIANDVNGAYPKNDGTIGQIPLDKDGNPKFNFYNTDAIWGGYWNLTQLWTLVWPEYLNDFVQTHLQVYKDAGWLGDGLANSRYVSGVGTNFVGLVIAGAYNSGIKDYDVELAYEAILKDNLEYNNRARGAGKIDIKPFLTKGYIPLEMGREDSIASEYSVSRSLEYSFSSYAGAQMAKALGKTDDYNTLMALSDNWRNLFDEELAVVRPRDLDGKFVDNFDPTQPWRGFQEGNANSYTFFVPHNPQGLIEKLGRDEFNKRLNQVFEASQKNAFCGGAENIDAFSGLSFAYNHGNQPCLHMPWLFNYSGKPWLTQKWTRTICDEFYGTDGIHGYGYGQDEDQGQLSAWYVMASLGLFDVQGLVEQDATFQIGSPVFNHIDIKLGNGKNLIIQANNNSLKNKYVQKVTFNNKDVDKRWIYRDSVLKGGMLKLEMDSIPKTIEAFKTITPVK
ncbi:glycoside hydrolase family 92 protein [Seonamhaeicola sediminis]|uniref:Glycoside hydrolase family 92 protein n=1 Tax=Seonamhaeicola sediminis TaxID=2528206 RepID=A0A562YHY9_9FLAO|nr:GH92 family glycosyl hydrolase [Seonamhaeicola sediminis]TWO34682.1 glycoside hydrolase family 92 protein [Seonamhaeicola sediminis]